MKKYAFLLLLLAILIISGWKVYSWVFLDNVNDELPVSNIYIPKDASLTNVIDSLKQYDILSDISSFQLVAKWMKYDGDKIKSGKYKIQEDWNNRKLIQHLRSGKQEAINVTINNVRQADELAGQIAKNLEVDSTQLAQYFKDPKTLDKYKLSEETFLSNFIPNTYEFYWTTPAEKIMDRFEVEKNKFWNQKDRLNLAKKIGLTPIEVYTLASIVEKESNLERERPRIAGVYLNRLERGILLQADPTVVFANKDFAIKRVLNKHLALDSPYNTYKYIGLPPGPIYMPSISSIDAVLNAEKHQYIFFCAQPGYGSEHAFAKTLREHNSNAEIYRTWLNSEKIK